MKIITLPEELERITIADMQVGETGYTVPWAMMVDRNRGCWIRGDYLFERRPFGTLCMKITRGQEGFAVEIPRGERYTVSDSDMRQEIRDWGALPVIAISLETE